MNHLTKIKDYVDAHGVGCAIVDNHVAIDIVWTTRTIGGAERRREMTERVTSFEEAARVLGCQCDGGAITA